MDSKQTKNKSGTLSSTHAYIQANIYSKSKNPKIIQQQKNILESLTSVGKKKVSKHGLPSRKFCQSLLPKIKTVDTTLNGLTHTHTNSEDCEVNLGRAVIHIHKVLLKTKRSDIVQNKKIRTVCKHQN